MAALVASMVDGVWLTVTASGLGVPVGVVMGLNAVAGGVSSCRVARAVDGPAG